MKPNLLSVCVILFALIFTLQVHAEATKSPVAIAVHGGASTIKRENLSDEQEQQYRLAMARAAQIGHEVLKAGKPGEQAVIAAITFLEDSPLFNAGVGAVYTYDVEHELDASIMHGGTLNAGAVAGVKHIKNPIKAAHAVMDKSVHVMLTGEGAEKFAFSHGIKRVENDHFNTQRRLDALNRAKAKIDENAYQFISDPAYQKERMGTVGVVVLDSQGNLVAGTSTGGMTAKRFGRVGDSPIIGAGTYADNASCAVSATGHGEFFIRYNVAADICARVKYQQVSLAVASDEVINKVLKNAGAEGGVVAIDRHGNISMPFNTPGMYRSSIDVTGQLTVGIYSNE